MMKFMEPIMHIQLPSKPSVACEGNFYFLEYVEMKLVRYNMAKHVKFLRDDVAIPDRYHQISDRIQEMCTLLEHLYPKLYVNISRQLKITLRSEAVICDIFRTFCLSLFKAGISWSRIFALFAVASGLILDCIREGHAEFCRTVLYCVKIFIEDSLAGWIKDQGGWESISEYFHDAWRVDTWYGVVSSFPRLALSFFASLPEKLENWKNLLSE